MREVITIGLDIAKSVFQVHGVDVDGPVVIRKPVGRAKVVEFFGDCRLVSSAWKRAQRRTNGHANSRCSGMIRGSCRRAMPKPM